jgi:hypothetical protein
VYGISYASASHSALCLSSPPFEGIVIMKVTLLLL